MKVKVAIAQINSVVGDIEKNFSRIVDFAYFSAQKGVDILLTPELSLVGYPPEDLLFRPELYIKIKNVLEKLIIKLKVLKNLYVIVGYPTITNNFRYNSASVFLNGKIIFTYSKLHLPNNSVFDEKRYFVSSNLSAMIFKVKNTRFGINICEDAWFEDSPIFAKNAGAQVLLILNASPYHINKLSTRYEIMRKNVSKHKMSLIFVNLVGGQDELVFDGNSFVLDETGAIVSHLAHAKEDFKIVEFCGTQVYCSEKFQLKTIEQSLEEQIYKILVLGVRDYVIKNNFSHVTLGLSGGVDSALTLAIAIDALGANNVYAVMMPSQYTSKNSLIAVHDLVKNTGVHYNEISIKKCFFSFLRTLKKTFYGFKIDQTEENIQARIRGTLLMALSNKFGSLVLTSGNKSEIAVGYCTLYGDMAGGFAVLKDITKTFVYRLCHYRNSISEIIPKFILTRLPSAELRFNQVDQDSLPPYSLIDYIIKMYVENNYATQDIMKISGYAKHDIEHVIKLIKINEHKRRQVPIGIRVTNCAFGRDWRYPITSNF